METVLAFVIGALYAAGLFMMLRPSAVRLIIGISLLGHAANLLIFTIAGLTRARPPLISSSMTGGATVQRVIQIVGTDDLDQMKATDS
jgi:multicomponent Na+:H+ antiporter subunit C